MVRKNYKTIPADTRQIIAGPEGQVIEFKRSHGSVDQKDLVAFANADGGIILIGVDEITDGSSGKQIGRVVGCDITDSAQRSIVSKAEGCNPSVNLLITIENSNRKPILRVEINGGENKPYSTASGDYKIRNGASNGKIDPALMKQMIIESESEVFVGRFREAGNEILLSIGAVEDSILGAVQSVEDAAHDAIDAANEATDAANEATAAVESLEDH